MSSFTRFAAVAAVILSLGILVASAPLAIKIQIPTCTGTDPISVLCAKLAVDMQLHLKTLLECTSLDAVKAAILAVVASLQICADGLLEVGTEVAIDAQAKTSIVACVAAIISVMVQVFVQISVKFGIEAVVAICAQIDVVLRLLLVNLNICIDGVVALIVKVLASGVVGLLAQLKFGLCLGVFGL